MTGALRGVLGESGSGAVTVHSHPTGNTSWHRGQGIALGEPRSGARDLHLGHTPYRLPHLSGNRTALVGRETIVQRYGSLPRRSSTASGRVTGFRLTSTTTSSAKNSVTRYHAPRRSGYGPATLRRSHS